MHDFHIKAVMRGTNIFAGIFILQFVKPLSSKRLSAAELSQTDAWQMVELQSP